MGGLTPQQALSLYSSENPFASAGAHAYSNYSLYHGGTLVRLLDWRKPSPRAKLAHRAFRSFVTSGHFSCVAGKAAIQRGSYRFGYYEALADPKLTAGLARDLCAFAAEYEYIAARYKSFVAVFGGGAHDESDFERQLWAQLQQLHELDSKYFAWAPDYSGDPEDATFAFSFAGCAFFVVGLHPSSSRLSRRFSQPALVFNAHRQFDELRASGHFSRIQQLVRERELALQGTLNPNLAEFGDRSEARQYAGGAVPESWRCPFHKT
jgi:FPC/CPF motif-containing protein YcgG